MNLFKRMYINFVLNKESKKVGLKRQASKFHGGYQPNDNRIHQPTFNKPLCTGSGIGHNPSPIGEKPKFPGRRENTSQFDLFKELLNNPRVESVMISHERVGEIEQTDIKAKLKERGDK